MLGKARELFDLPLVVCVFILFTALEYSEAFTLVEDELLSYRQVLDTRVAISKRSNLYRTFA